MTFDVGDKVVYPHHGAAIVERREVKEAFGEKKEYLVLRLAYGDLTLMVPADNTDEVGLREVINDEEVEEVRWIDLAEAQLTLSHAAEREMVALALAYLEEAHKDR